MSARAPFRPAGAVSGAQAQAKTQPPAASQPSQDQQVTRADDSLLLLPPTKTNPQVDQPARPLNSLSLKKLTSKKNSSRGESLASNTKDGLAEAAIHSPSPRQPPTLFGQPVHTPHRPPSRAAIPPTSDSPPLDAPHPPSRSPLPSYEPHASSYHTHAMNIRTDTFSPALPQSASPDISEIPFMPHTINQRVDPSESYPDSRRRNSGNNSTYQGLSNNARNSADFFEQGVKRGPPEMDSAHQAKRARGMESEMQYHRRETSPFSDITDIHDDRHTNRRRRQPSTHPLQVLLGNFDLETFAGARAQQYEAEITKWQSCSRAEWEAHATVLSNKFAALLDMVKDHMGLRALSCVHVAVALTVYRRKIQLYTSLQGITEKQRIILEERDHALDDIRQELLNQARGVGGR